MHTCIVPFRMSYLNRLVSYIENRNTRNPLFTMIICFTKIILTVKILKHFTEQRYTLCVLLFRHWKDTLKSH